MCLRDSYYNEARFLRAHFYAMMLPVYGPVFLIGDDPVDFTQSGLDQRERNTCDECVNYVANDLWDCLLYTSTISSKC